VSTVLAASQHGDVLLASSQNLPGFGDQPFWISLIKTLGAGHGAVVNLAGGGQ
jgi:hypothetical protein